MADLRREMQEERKVDDKEAQVENEVEDETAASVAGPGDGSQTQKE